MGHTFSKDMDSVWKWLNRSHWGKLGGSGFNDAMANNMNDSSQLNQWSSGNPEEAESSNESAYWWNRMKNALPNPSLKLPHLHQSIFLIYFLKKMKIFRSVFLRLTIPPCWL